MRFQNAISASRLITSKRMRTSWMRSWIVSSLVALSTTYSGVVTLPQSCSQLAICTASHSSSPRSKSRYGPSFASHAARASISVSSGTRAQWPPV